MTDRTHKDYGLRTMPVVGGINAQPLQPSIGTGHWAVSAGQTRIRNAQIRRAAPIRTGKAELLPGKARSKHVGQRGDVSGGKANRAAKVKSHKPQGCIRNAGYQLPGAIF